MTFDIDTHIKLVAACVIRDAIAKATPAGWDRTADRLETALPRPGDYLGRSTAAERAAREARLRTRIAACRNAAAFWRHIHSETPLELTAAETAHQAAA